MSNIEDALYADPRLVGIYDLLNSGDSDFKFYLERLGKENRRVLDLGCGTGTFALRLTAIGHTGFVKLTAADYLLLSNVVILIKQISEMRQ
ncbi:Ribosomal protein L11 methyltransferase (plasmid) [Burkholderia sp. AD24]|nr:Ribosomal protein L11 methyltransferase [Burkholderia sp. AD24]